MPQPLRRRPDAAEPASCKKAATRQALPGTALPQHAPGGAPAPLQQSTRRRRPDSNPCPPPQADKAPSFTRGLSGSLAQNYDAVIGSLPKGLSEDQRIKIAGSMPMSPAVGMLQTLPEVGFQIAWGLHACA